MPIAKSERLTVLSEVEQEALYGLPDFDDAQRLEYLAMTETELALVSNRPGLHAQVYCILQIGYFRAKHAFFRFAWEEIEDDAAFVLSRYFHGETFERKSIVSAPWVFRSRSIGMTGHDAGIAGHVGPEYPQAVSWFHKAADQGDASA